ncbi:hypothetical protein CHS0354_010185 [Potamilus streckersoni]|uniref:Uncharacterized protein n=1 Tax=Potamilus streckersoni TaxID=2493646 RepID=A0AAE0VI78_9BIVA|nr:hypothetical protein CHS0354_010185 [Potamilus streckersoni]
MITENARGILLMFSLTTFLQNSTGQVLSDEILFQHHSCYGSNEDYSIVNASCSADTVIAVSTVQAGAKLNNSSCPIAVDGNITVDFEYCCRITVDDCPVNVSTTIWHALCSGNESCLASQAVSVPSNCTSMFRSNTSNMQLDYYCINITRIGSTCTHVTMTTADNALYLWNTGYSYGVNTDTDCVCSIQVESCDAHIDVTAMRIDLKDDNGTCIQNITFSDSYGNPEMVIDCSKEYDITSLFRSTTNYLSMNFISARNNTLGKYWIRFKAAEAKSNLQVNCNPVEQQITCTTTSTTTTSSTTTTATRTTTTTITSTTTTSATQTTSATTTRTTPTTKTHTTPSTAASTMPTKETSTTTEKTEEKQQEDLRYIAYTTLLVPIGIAILYLFRRRHPMKPYNQPATRTSSTISLPDELKSISPEIATTVYTTPTPLSHIYTKIPPARKVTTGTQREESHNPQVICTPNIPPISVNYTLTTPMTPTTTTVTTSMITALSVPSQKACACSFCGQLGKHYHPTASSSGKYSERKHFRCRYCGIFWDKTTSLPLYSPCQFQSKQY